MTAIIVIAIIGCIISALIEEGGFLTKFIVCAIVAAIAFLLLKWITDWELMSTLAKVSGVAAIVAAALGIIIKIFD